LVVALIRDPGKGHAEGARDVSAFQAQILDDPAYGSVGAMGRPRLMTAMAATTLRTLPPPFDGVLYLIGDSTLKQSGAAAPLGHTTRHSEHDPYTFGFEMVLLIASWDRFRIPLALVPIDPQCRGHQNILFRQMLKAFVPPHGHDKWWWSPTAGFAANETLRLIAAKKYAYVFCDATDTQIYQWQASP